MRKLADKILKLRKNGKSYNEISKILHCSKGLISYHLGIGQKQKTRNRTKKRRAKHPYIKKIETFQSCKHNQKIKNKVHKWKKLIQMKIDLFCGRYRKDKNMKSTFTVDDVIAKFGEKPKCYLTGEDIDIYQPRTYHFDHKVPVSRGGERSIHNLGICTKQANMAKSDLTPEEFFELCQKVINFQNSVA